MNSQDKMPFCAISPNIISDKEIGISYLSGTGFFVYFPPFETCIFYITARHCIVKNNIDIKSVEIYLKIQYFCIKRPEFNSFGIVKLDNCISIRENQEVEEDEDILIFTVDYEGSELKRHALLQRSLKLWHQDDVTNFLEAVSSSKNEGKVRVIGFPSASDTGIDYDENMNIKQLTIQPRGFNGYAEKDGNNIYKIIDTNWKEKRLEGFSGSPVLALCAYKDIFFNEKVKVGVVGVVLTGSNTNKMVKFININIATQAIAQFLHSKGYLIPQED